MEGFKRIYILGCPFDAIRYDETVDSMRQAVRGGAPLQIVPGSIDFVMKAKRDESFAERLRTADLVVADGVPIVWAASLLGTPIRGRVSGTELVWSCARVSAEAGVPMALVGAADGVAPRAAARMMERYPGACIQAIPTPFPLRHAESLEIAKQARRMGAGILLAALGAPRQEAWIQQYREKSGASVGIGVGSAFDIICGDKPRAPQWMQNAGMEWLHRMMLEPKRLGRRYLVEDSPFLFYLAKEMAAKPWRQTEVRS